MKLREAGAVFAAAVTVAMAPAGAVSPDVLKTAVDAAVAASQARYAFEMAVTERRNDNPETSYRLSYDPRRDPAWVVAAADDAARDAAEKAAKSLDAADGDDRLLYDRLFESIDGVRLIEDVGDAAIFAADVVNDDVPDGALELRLTYDKAGGHVAKIETVLREPFKPNPAVKVKALTQVQQFGPVSPGGPAFLKSTDSRTVANAFFKSYDVDIKTEYFNIESVALTPQAE